MDPFKNIRPYTDSEVDQVLQSLTSNESVIKAYILDSLLQGEYPQKPKDSEASDENPEEDSESE